MVSVLGEFETICMCQGGTSTVILLGWSYRLASLLNKDEAWILLGSAHLLNDCSSLNKVCNIITLLCFKSFETLSTYKINAKNILR